MDFTVLDYEVLEEVAVVTMNHAPRNALGPEFLADFERVLSRLRGGGEARAVVVASACPGFFSAGDDIKSLREAGDELFEFLPKAHAVLDELEALPLPTVAAINGHALGGADQRILAGT